MQGLKCILYTLTKSNVVAYGRVYKSSKKQNLHGVPLQDDCYRVSVDNVVKPQAFLPNEIPDATLVGEALNNFVAWPKDLVKILDEVCFF